MYVLTFYYLTLVLPALASPNNKDPLVALYYPIEEVYAISDFSTVERILRETELTTPEFSHILFYCAAQNTDSNTHLQFREIIPNVFPTILGREKCSEKHFPGFINTDDDNRVCDGYEACIGYEVHYSDTTEIELFERYKIPKFPLHDEKGEKVKLIRMNRNLTQLFAYETVHRIYSYNRNLLSNKTCQHYGLTPLDEQDRSISKYYEPDNQNKLFEIYKKPSNSPAAYFVQQKMIPIDDFAEDNSRMATCVSNYTTVPIWNKISETILNRVEKAIQLVAEELYAGTLTIKTQAIGTLELESHDNTGYKKVFLDYENERIPVPKYLVKVIAYRPHFPIKKEDVFFSSNLERQYMIIVVQNELTPTSEKICPPHDCKVHGWHGLNNIRNQYEPGSVYCCTYDDPSLAHHLLVDIPISYEPFSLKKVVTHRSIENNEILHTINVANKLFYESKKN